MRTNASSSSNKNSANTFASSVLPTPEGPIKINEPIGRSGFFSPERARRIASDIAAMASSCPIIFFRIIGFPFEVAFEIRIP